MLRRELTIAFRARVTWMQAALSALLVGHGFVLAIDLFSAGSRSVEENVLMARQFDPLLGIVRPTLGGLYLAMSLLGVVAGARTLAIERERRTLEPLLLLVGSPLRVAASAYAGAVAAIALQLIAPVLLVSAWRIARGHLDVVETLVALSAYVMYLLFIAGLSTAAAAWSKTFAQAVTAGLVIVALSWAIDAAEGFAALAWLGRIVDWSVTTHLQAMERGTLRLGDLLWMGVAIAALFSAATIGLRHDFTRARRMASLALVVLIALPALSAARRVQRGFDLTESRRSSLPPAAIAALRTIHEPIAIDVYLDRDDARRRQIESDALAKLRLARPDIDVTMPLDAEHPAMAGNRDDRYGQIVLRVGTRSRTSYSTSRRELTTLAFELAGIALPDWQQVEYPGYPLVIEGQKRSILLALAYAVIPAALLSCGLLIGRNERTRS